MSENVFHINKLDCLSLAGILILVYYLRISVEPTWVGLCPRVGSWLGRRGELGTNTLAYFSAVSLNKFYTIDTQDQCYKTIKW